MLEFVLVLIINITIWQVTLETQVSSNWSTKGIVK